MGGGERTLDEGPHGAAVAQRGVEREVRGAVGGAAQAVVHDHRHVVGVRDAGVLALALYRVHHARLRALVHHLQYVPEHTVQFFVDSTAGRYKISFRSQFIVN